MTEHTVLKNYGECLEWLYQQHKIRFGLERVAKMIKLFDYPCERYKTIHVAGTNGKSSVCYKIFTLLKLKKYSVGLYTSPHIVCLRERIKVNDEIISEEELLYLVNEIVKKCKSIGLKPSFFEIMTVVAFLHFSNKRVDYAVIETGLGGRQDATNVLKKPEVAVITSIGYDHMPCLGNDLPSICNEKIGIFKKDTNIVIGPSVSIFRSVYERAKELNCKIVSVQAEPRGITANEENSQIALEVIKMLKIKTTDFLQSLTKIKLPLRLQYLASEQMDYFKREVCFKNNGYSFSETEKYINNPYAVILDVGHNMTAMDQLCRDINYFHKNKSLRIGFSLTKPRNVDIIKPFWAHFPGRLLDIYYLPSGNARTYELVDIIHMIKDEKNLDENLKNIFFNSTRKMCQWFHPDSANEDLESAAQHCKKGSIPTIVENAFLECCKDNCIFLLTGSFFFFEEVLDTLHIYAGDKDPLYMNECQQELLKDRLPPKNLKD